MQRFVDIEVTMRLITSALAVSALAIGMVFATGPANADSPWETPGTGSSDYLPYD
ncbi:hypothetical protein [Actinomadura welshii]|uniref:hypothetical protein n=1 Tax=Actinomadura welshii TaxID=3103817 RepID=UPI00137688FD|nr:hypothetical protein [Actinomadura madurae]